MVAPITQYHVLTSDTSGNSEPVYFAELELLAVVPVVRVSNNNNNNNTSSSSGGKLGAGDYNSYMSNASGASTNPPTPVLIQVSAGGGKDKYFFLCVKIIL